MDNLKKARLIFYAVSALALLQLAAYYPFLPEKVASHFNFAGKADGWWDKEYFAVFWAMLLAFLVGTFALTEYLVSKAPDSVINLPNKDWWLAPERRAETIKSVVAYLYQMAAVTVLFLGIMIYLTFRASVDGSGNLGTLFIPLLGLYLAYCAIYVIMLYRRFSRIPGGGK